MITEPSALESFTYSIGSGEVIHSSWMAWFSPKISQCGGVIFYPLKDVNDIQIDDITDPLKSIAVFTEGEGLKIKTDNQ